MVWRLLLLLLATSGCASIGQVLLHEDTVQRRERIGYIRHRVTVADHEIAYLERPGKGEPILLIHGFGGDQDSHNKLAEHLPKENRLLSPSMAGFGTSTYIESSSYDIVRQAERLAAFLDELGVARVHVVGVSMGGAVATTFAARFPDKTMTLTAICPAGITPPVATPYQLHWRDGVNELIISKPAQFDHYLDLLFYGDPPEMPFVVRAYLIDELIAKRLHLLKIDGDFRKRPVHLRDEVEAVAAPTLVIWGKEDEILHYSGSTIFADLDDVKIVLLDGCGHACSYTRAKEVAEIIRDFIGY